ncbi:major facilitator superfamily domain-containing protein [Suillus lakei]|nr:major facilitator superfamily domain-containing protein [Suillus lakei]
MVSEESPLLASAAHELIYDRFEPDQKRWIVFLVSVVVFVSATFVPSIPQIARDLDSTHDVVSLTVSLSILASAVGALVWAAYSSFYGRRSIYLWGMPFLCVRSCGVVMSTSLRSLLFWRFMQTFGCSGGMSLGAGVIGDIYKLEERGTAVGVFFGVRATLFGLAVTPFLGGAAAQYWSWRNLHYCLGEWGLLEMLLIYLSRWIHITWVNPLSSLLLLRSPNLFAVMLAWTLVVISDFVLLVPLAYTIGIRYDIANQAIIGACFLPNGLGNFIGAPVAGRLSDIAVRRWREKCEGVWCPEDRLRATWIGGLIIVPLSIGASGLITTYVGGPMGLWLNLLCLFTTGMGVDFVVNPIGSYNVDVVRSRSAEVTAASAAVRSLILSAATALVIPSIERIGVAWTDIIAAVLALIGQGIIFLTISYGDRMRASVDVGFTTENR